MNRSAELQVGARFWIAPVPWRVPSRCMPGKAAEDCRSPRRCRALPPLEASSWSQCMVKKSSPLSMNRPTPDPSQEGSERSCSSPPGRG